MAIDIDLNIYSDSAETRHLGCIRLYFGKSLPTKWKGWDWVEQNGMAVDPPGALNDRNKKRGVSVQRETLLRWINEGYLSPDPFRNDSSGSFLDNFPENAAFRLSFLDWS